MDFYNFHYGQEFEAYRKLGAHIQDGGAMFRVYAPAAAHVAVIGEFSDWQDVPMQRGYDGQIWEVFVPGAESMQMYKYRIYKYDGSFIDHQDPYAYLSERRPGTASVLYDMRNYEFHDAEWMKNRTAMREKPLNIYELHFGSWRKPGEDKEDWYAYDELGDILIPYLKENGYNYLELMPLNEYPADGSWGYQATGFFSATSRYGTPDQLRAFVDQCHANGIGVLLDIVTVHFAVNDFALWNYDGTALYEYPNKDVGYNEWGSCNFNHWKPEVCSFLQSASAFWLDEYHFDGLRMDAVGNLIYWQGEEARGENKGAIEFLKRMNRGLKEKFPTAILVAEDSSAYPKVTTPVDWGGLGFDYKWDMGWMNDTLNYFRTPSAERPAAHNKLTFSMAYFYNENYMLPLSHDEVVHGKATIVQKMEGLYEGKFDQARAMYLYMYAHPGKKLNFMGNEFAQFREWDEEKEQDWFMLKYPIHDAFHHFMMDLNHLYLTHPAFWAKDFDPAGFQWVEADLNQQSVYVFKRHGGGESLLFVFNFSAETRTYDYHEVFGENMKLLLDSNLQPYHGKDPEGEMDVTPDDHGVAHLTLKPFTALCYSLYDPNNQKKKGEPKSNGKTKDVLAGDHKLHKG
ncbi:MAG: 1,4-alpha-glucan branching protein GlgB [Acutalibacteraceae bacterium]|nr:1,4-alpha-glucan branching protein GlgB [Acutalibacteraceae bacterium]